MLDKEMKAMLTDTIIPFWRGLKDEENGGYYGYVNFDLAVDKQAEKGCILNSRILWFFSTAATVLQDPLLLGDAKHAYAFLTDHCMDKEYGGVYWSVNADGSVQDDTKHTYNQAFAVYALSAYYEASKDSRALSLAHELFQLIEDRCRDESGYGEAYSRDFCPVSNEKLSENGVIAERTMNTLLHVFEGYAGLQQADPTAAVAEKMAEILCVFRDKVYHPEKMRQEVFFDKDMRSLLDLHSYGHDIEASWLLDWGAQLIDRPHLAAEVAAITQKLAENIYQAAYHKHSVWNEAEHGVPDKTRIWWVQAEALVGFLNAYEKAPQEKKYLQAVSDIFQYIQTYLCDPREGSEWYWEVDDNGIPSSRKPIVEPWKCPYHNGRMCFEYLRRTAK